jgi:hypothetical protein
MENEFNVNAQSLTSQEGEDSDKISEDLDFDRIHRDLTPPPSLPPEKSYHGTRRGVGSV